MPVVLWLLGLVTTVAGLLLVASAVGPHDGTFDSETLTPGMVGVVGGLLLVGLGIAVRELRRIERALAARSERSTETVTTQTSAMPAAAPARAATKVEPKAEVDDVTAAVPIVQDEVLERLRTKFPVFARRQNGPIVQDLHAPPASPSAHVEVEEAIAAEVGSAAAGVARAASSGARSARPAPRSVAKAAGVSPMRTNGSVPSTFRAVGPRRDDQEALVTAAVQISQPVTGGVSETSGANEPEPGEEPDRLAESDTQPAEASVTVLKSGVVEGMAYTLYSDGSIEAKLPQGTLRFGSISALRDHIEGTAE